MPTPPEDMKRASIHQAALYAAIQKLHCQTGHPPAEQLARAIRLAGGSDEAVSCALQYRCTVCASQVVPGPALPHALHGRAREFADVVAMDTFELADWAGNKVLFLNIIGVATRIGIVAVLSSRRPIAVWECSLASWASWVGFPRNILVDGGGEFEREFRQECEVAPISAHTSAAYAP